MPRTPKRPMPSGPPVGPSFCVRVDGARRGRTPARPEPRIRKKDTSTHYDREIVAPGPWKPDIEVSSCASSTPVAVTLSPSSLTQEFSGDPRRRIDARVALALLETLQKQDLPEEVLVDENLSVTLPRRLGLSHVVDAQVRRYREEVRRKHRVPEPEVVDLVRLVARRPDAAHVFHKVGRALAASQGEGWGRFLPRRLVLRRARRRATDLLRDLFGKEFVRSHRGDAGIEVEYDLMHMTDPSGAACSLVTGVLEVVAESSLRTPIRIRRRSCLRLGDAACAWDMEEHRPELVPNVAGEDGGLAAETTDSDADAAGRDAKSRPGDEALSA